MIKWGRGLSVVKASALQAEFQRVQLPSVPPFKQLIILEKPPWQGCLISIRQMASAARSFGASTAILLNSLRMQRVLRFQPNALAANKNEVDARRVFAELAQWRLRLICNEELPWVRVPHSAPCPVV